MCPKCDAPQPRWIGHEVRGVYDGVLYWSCTVCGHAWNRWTSDYGRRFDTAERLVGAHNDAVARALHELAAS